MAKNNRYTKVVPGMQFVIPAGCPVTIGGVTQNRLTDSTVTVRSVEYRYDGRARIVWKSNGRRASTLLRAV